MHRVRLTGLHFWVHVFVTICGLCLLIFLVFLAIKSLWYRILICNSSNTEIISMDFYYDVRTEKAGRYHYILFWTFRQCSGSVTFWYVSGCEYGSPDPYLWLTDLDADPVPDTALSSGTFLKFLCLFFFEGTVHLHHSSKIKSQESHKTVEIKVFLNFFACW